jgi:hypothetical protein
VYHILGVKTEISEAILLDFTFITNLFNLFIFTNTNRISMTLQSREKEKKRGRATRKLAAKRRTNLGRALFPSVAAIAQSV